MASGRQTDERRSEASSHGGSRRGRSAARGSREGCARTTWAGRSRSPSPARAEALRDLGSAQRKPFAAKIRPSPTTTPAAMPARRSDRLANPAHSTYTMHDSFENQARVWTMWTILIALSSGASEGPACRSSRGGWAHCCTGHPTRDHRVPRSCPSPDDAVPKVLNDVALHGRPKRRGLDERDQLVIPDSRCWPILPKCRSDY